MVLLPLSDNPEYADIVPVPQDDGPEPVVKILYSEEFSEVMDYFRAFLKSDEKSERALRLMGEVIRLNPANYTAWYFRRLCLDAIGADLRTELAFVDDCTTKSPKNYQVWQHRRHLVEKLDDPSQELAITGEILKLDAKNYHAWAHRQWVLKSFQLWSSELEFASSLLQEDISKFRSPLFTRIHFSDLKNILIGNNSAWNHRFFILSNFKGFSLEVVNTEIDYTTDLILKAPNNLSPWNYLSGLLSETGFDHSISQKILHFTEVLSPPNEHSIALLIEIHEKCIDLQDLSKSQSLCAEASKLDPIRKSYWDWKFEQLSSMRRT